jgi:hypothetical protein
VIYPIAQLFFWTTIILWFILGSQILWPIIAMLLKLIPEWVVFYQKGKLLQMRKSTTFYPVFNLFESFWYVVTGINAFFTKKIKW